MEKEIVKVLRSWMMEGEIYNFIKVWISVLISLLYTFLIPKRFSPGFPRFLSLIPIITLFFILPLNLHTMHLGGLTSFFIAWLANFKLLMFVFNTGPLSDQNLSIITFIALACLPIKIQNDPHPKKGRKSILSYSVKALLMALLIRLYDYEEDIHPAFMVIVLGLLTYFGLEITMGILAEMARAVLGAELEPQFNEPYLSTSLQDFWGRRWNIMVSRILRPSVYEPVLKFSSGVIGRDLAPLPAVFGTFMMSAVMHELIFYYLGRVKPTGEITVFFLVHGVCLLIEIAVKKKLKTKTEFNVPRIVSGLSTVGLVFLTGSWLFFPVLVRLGAVPRAMNEYAAVGSFFREFRAALQAKKNYIIFLK